MAAALAVLSAGLAACGGDRPDRLVGAVREPRPDVSGVSLPEAGAGPFRFVAAPGHVLLAYFGYTSCPDVCPTTLADLKVVYADLGDAAERVDLAMVTIDPEVDTGELLTAYVRSFVPRAHAIVATDDVALRAAADAFGADYGVVVNAEGVREVFHTASVYAVDDAGEIRVSWSYGTPADDVVHDLRLLLAG